MVRLSIELGDDARPAAGETETPARALSLLLAQLFAQLEPLCGLRRPRYFTSRKNRALEVKGA